MFKIFIFTSNEKHIVSPIDLGKDHGPVLPPSEYAHGFNM